MTPTLYRAIEHISDEINDEYTLVKCLRKGIIYHHASIPDNVRYFVEYLYSTCPEIKYVIANSTLLEGVNFPISQIFLLDIKKGKGYLTPAELRNLTGRVCRFNDIFNETHPDLSKLSPKIYFVENEIYLNKNTNLENYLKNHLSEEQLLVDDVQNILLDKKEVSESQDQKKLKVQQEFLENFQKDTIPNYLGRHAQTEIGRLCVQNNLTGVDIFSSEDQMEVLRKTCTEASSATEVIELIYKLFSPLITEQQRKNKDFGPFFRGKGLRGYALFLDWKLKNKSFNEMVYLVVRHWSRLKGTPKSFIYVGARWGNVALKGQMGNSRLNWVDVNKLSSSQLINLAIVRVKEEMDYIDNFLMRFIEIIHDIKLIQESVYLKLKYGTEDPFEIVLIKNGFSNGLARLLHSNKYQPFVQIDMEENIVELDHSLINLMKQEEENSLLSFEAETYVN